MQYPLRNEAVKIIQSRLSPKFNNDEIHALKFWMVDALLEISQDQWNLHLEQWIQSLETHVPVQYIFNRAFFGSLDLYVNQHTLIPRPETEELCELILNESQNSVESEHQVFDIGTGSGCIPIWLKHQRPLWNMTAVDISNQALQVAQVNASKYQTDIKFLHQNFLEFDTLPNQYSILISNPPYIQKNQLSKLNKNVINFEPHLALFVENNDPLIFYKKIAKLLEKNDSVKQIWLEIDTETAEENVTIFKKIGAAEIISDYSSNPRFIKCIR